MSKTEFDNAPQGCAFLLGFCLIGSVLLLVLSIVSGGIFDSIFGTEMSEHKEAVFMFFWLFVIFLVISFIIKKKSEK